MGDTLSTPSGLVDNHVQGSGFQSPCVESGRGIGQRPIRDVYWDVQRVDPRNACAHWPGRGQGVRGPVADETPLSAAEVSVLLREGL